jgi:hypothetical protein
VAARTPRRNVYYALAQMGRQSVGRTLHSRHQHDAGLAAYTNFRETGSRNKLSQYPSPKIRGRTNSITGVQVSERDLNQFPKAKFLWVNLRASSE